MISYQRKPIADLGIDESAKRLTPEKIEKTINAVLNGTGARLKAYLDTCIHCALCSEACHYYLSHDKDPTYSPVAKVKMTIWEMVKNKGKVSADFIKQCSELPIPSATVAAGAACIVTMVLIFGISWRLSAVSVCYSKLFRSMKWIPTIAMLQH